MYVSISKNVVVEVQQDGCTAAYYRYFHGQLYGGGIRSEEVW